MPSLFDGLDNVQKSLSAQQFALSITQRNIANANNTSYTRQQVIFTDGEGSYSGIPGVYIESSRNQYLDFNVNQEIQSSTVYEHMSEALSQIESLFGTDGDQGLQHAVSEFFGSFRKLSSAPEDLTLRQEALSSAGNLTAVFHSLYSGLRRLQISEDRRVPHTVEEINSLTSEIASLNEKVQAAVTSEDGTSYILRDQRQKCLEELSGLMNISYFENELGAITVTTKTGVALVLDHQNYELETGSISPNPFSGVFLNGTEITSSLDGGELGGLIRIRDGMIPGYLNALDTMAATIVSEVNTQHGLGSDLDGAAGGDLFVPFTPPASGDNSGAAWLIQVAITDPRLIATASATGGPGNNENARSIADIEEANLFAASTETLNQFYSSLVYKIGSDARTAEDQTIIHESVLQQLKNQRDSDIAVNLDEEAVNIIKFQKAYEACARYASTVIALSDEILRLLGG